VPVTALVIGSNGSARRAVVSKLKQQEANQLVSDILNTYQLRSTLGRLEFLVGVLSVSILVGLLALAVRYLLFPEPDRTYLLFRVGVEILAAILVLPLVIARLRDIGWHPLVSLLIFVPIPFDPKLWIALASNVGGSIPVPGWVILLSPLLFFVHLFFLLTLLFWKGRATTAA